MVVETGRSAVFKHRVEVLVEGSEAYVGTGAVEATRYNQDTLVLLTTKDAENTEAPLVRLSSAAPVHFQRRFRAQSSSFER